jgi:hypothetical protein
MYVFCHIFSEKFQKAFYLEVFYNFVVRENVVSVDLYSESIKALKYVFEM